MRGPTSGGNGRGGGNSGDSGRGLTDAELRAILGGMSQVMEETFDRLDDQTRALHKLTAAVEALQAKTSDEPSIDPDYVARATAEAVRRVLVPEVNKIVEAMNELNGTKALLRERWRVVDREEARLGRWLFLPLGVTVGIPLALATVLALVMPSAVSQTPLTCRATGGRWSEPTDRFLAACVYTADKRAAAGGS